MIMTKNLTRTACCLALFAFSILYAQAQNIPFPRVSQQASVSQRIGITDISILYHSPAVNDRKIWGALVPFGQVWRAGANENTLITFSDPVTVEGKRIAAGSYGLYMKPSATSVDIIFSSATKNWGTVTPTEEEIVAKVTVTPQTSPHQEWLSYDFMDRGGNDAVAALKWETWTIPFKIEVDVPNVVLNNIRAELKGQAGFGYLGKEQAAQYCLFNDIALDEAMTWIDQSIAAEKRFTNLSVKSGLLKKQGKEEEAKKVMEAALLLATPVQVNVYGYQLLNNGNAKEATKIFLSNIEKTPKSHPFYWGFVDSVGEGYLKSGDKENAIKYYKMAKEYAPDNQQGYLDGVIKGIMEKS
jgi:tetratricopeptide (TPR) repeat protein